MTLKIPSNSTLWFCDFSLYARTFASRCTLGLIRIIALHHDFSEYKGPVIQCVWTLGGKFHHAFAKREDGCHTTAVTSPSSSVIFRCIQYLAIVFRGNIFFGFQSSVSFLKVLLPHSGGKMLVPYRKFYTQFYTWSELNLFCFGNSDQLRFGDGFIFLIWKSK